MLYEVITLEAAGAEVVRVTAYRKRVPEEAQRLAGTLFAEPPWGWVTFTSPSTVRNVITSYSIHYTKLYEDVLGSGPNRSSGPYRNRTYDPRIKSPPLYQLS